GLLPLSAQLGLPLSALIPSTGEKAGTVGSSSVASPPAATSFVPLTGAPFRPPLAAAATSTTATGAAAQTQAPSTAMAMAAPNSVATGGVPVAASSAGTQPVLPPPPAAVAPQQHQQQHMLPRIATLDSAKTGYFDASWGAMATEWEEAEAG
ncbi:unnamed protein product, partial [Ectocarpus sp. 13 AM-2016]